MALLDNIPASVVIVQRKQRIDDGLGGKVNTYLPDHQETVYIGAPNGHAVPVIHRKEGVNLFPIWSETSADIQFGDRLKLDDTRIYEIRNIHLEVPGGPYLKFLGSEYVPQQLTP